MARGVGMKVNGGGKDDEEDDACGHPCMHQQSKQAITDWLVAIGWVYMPTLENVVIGLERWRKL